MHSVKPFLDIYIVQPDIVWEDKTQSLLLIDELLHHEKRPVDLILLPEAFSTGFSMKLDIVADDETQSLALNWMKKTALEKNAVVCGTIFIVENGKYYNRFYWVEPNGDIKKYDKRHLFSMGSEDRFFTAGNQQMVIDFKGWKIFPQICYDLRFPVWSRNTMGYDLLINVANWPKARRDVWNTLIKARAIENQCYVAACNRVGIDGRGVFYVGDSSLIDASGGIVASLQEQEDVLSVRIDYKKLHDFRSNFNALADRDNFDIKG